MINKILKLVNTVNHSQIISAVYEYKEDEFRIILAKYDNDKIKYKYIYIDKVDLILLPIDVLINDLKEDIKELEMS